MIFYSPSGVHRALDDIIIITESMLGDETAV